MQLYQVYFHPDFQRYPLAYAYRGHNVTVPTSQSTLAIGLKARTVLDLEGKNTDSLVRVQFKAYLNSDFELDENYIDAVYCDELYAEEIAREENENLPQVDREYTKTFVDPTDYTRWICPNITNIYMNASRGLQVRLLPCGKAKGDKYAASVQCDESGKIPKSIELESNAVSAHFDPAMAHKSNTLQLYNTL